MNLDESVNLNKYTMTMSANDVDFVLGTVIQPPGYDRMLTPPQIIATIANIVNVSVKAMLGKNKAHHISHARQIAMMMVRDTCPSWSHSEIGRHFGQHHTTVLYGIRQARRRVEECQTDQKIYLKACKALRVPAMLRVKP